MIIELPWPPSVNTYWRHVGHKVLISKKGREYRNTVGWMSRAGPEFGDARLHIEIDAYPPDRRKRDLDNLPKAIFDSLQHGGMFDDDNQIDYFSVARKEIRKGGAIILNITRMINPHELQTN
jgi:crossover junction endodeoxyribonuclease RusA